MKPSSAAHIRSTSPPKLPIGVSDFAELVREGYTFVDKTLMIEELVASGAKVSLIARPRRFGKTLNLSMLQCFFAPEVVRRPTAGLFDTLAIARRPDVMAHQGRYPVIFFTFKDVRGDSFEAFEKTLRGKLATLFKGYPELENSPHVGTTDRNIIDAVLAETTGLTKMKDTFRFLSELLYRHHGQKVVILLDEYDAPIHAAYNHGYYERLINFMRPLLSSALKDNLYLHKAVLTGILRVSKENMFSGLNNTEVHTVLDDEYSRYFGFTEPEVSGLLSATGLAAAESALEGKIKNWYNGYRIGSQTIYNPWSIINCIKRRGEFQTYWAHTSGDDLLKKAMAQADADFKKGLENLIGGESVSKLVNPNLVFGNLDGNNTALWSLLLFSGYLTALSVKRAGTQVQCELAIPNQEIRDLYRDIIQQWFTDRIQVEGYQRLLESLVSGNVADFQSRLSELRLESMSAFDAQGRHPEKFYYGLVLGLMAGLRDTHVVRSNSESGHGRYDIALLPKSNAAARGIVMEFKQAPRVKGLPAAAKAALRQIDTRRYETELKQHRIKKIVSIGLAFSGKSVACAHVERSLQPRAIQRGVKRSPGSTARTRGSPAARRPRKRSR